MERVRERERMREREGESGYIEGSGGRVSENTGSLIAKGGCRLEG